MRKFLILLIMMSCLVNLLTAQTTLRRAEYPTGQIVTERNISSWEEGALSTRNVRPLPYFENFDTMPPAFGWEASRFDETSVSIVQGFGVDYSNCLSILIWQCSYSIDSICFHMKE